MSMTCPHDHWNGAMYRCDACGLTKEEIVRHDYVTDARGLPVPIGSVLPVEAGSVEMVEDEAGR